MRCFGCSGRVAVPSRPDTDGTRPALLRRGMLGLRGEAAEAVAHYHRSAE